MERNIVGKPKRVAGEFLSRRGQNQVVSARKRGVDSELGSCFLNHAELAHEVVLILGQQKCEIQVAKIVKHCTAARRTTRKLAVLTFQQLHAAFAPRILVSSYDDSAFVLPEVEGRSLALRFKEQLFQRKVFIWIDAVCA